jgi:superfamily II DNA/RNA helicase
MSDIFLPFRYLTLDEADRMIDMGFEEDVRTIFSYFKGGLISEEIFGLIPPSKKCEKSSTFQPKVEKLRIGTYFVLKIIDRPTMRK